MVAELTQEAEATRRVLERVDESRLSWKPHAKSMSQGQLAFHIAGLPRGIAELISNLTVETPTVPLREPKSRVEILDTLDESLNVATTKLLAWGDAGLAAEWRMKSDGNTVLAMPRIDVVRALMLNHWYHHRGQLTVYLRLLDVPLPPIYGPTADESPAG